MELLANAGKVKKLGISNIYSLPMLEEIYSSASVKPSVIQNHFQPQEGCYDKEIRKWCVKKDVRYQSFWTLTGNSPILDSAPLLSIAQSRGLTKEQVWFRFWMDQGVVPLSGTKNTKHMKEDLGLLSESALSK